MADELSTRLAGPIDQVIPGLNRLADTLELAGAARRCRPISASSSTSSTISSGGMSPLGPDRRAGGRPVRPAHPRPVAAGGAERGRRHGAPSVAHRGGTVRAAAGADREAARGLGGKTRPEGAGQEAGGRARRRPRRNGNEDGGPRRRSPELRRATPSVCAVRGAGNRGSPNGGDGEESEHEGSGVARQAGRAGRHGAATRRSRNRPTPSCGSRRPGCAARTSTSTR